MPPIEFIKWLEEYLVSIDRGTINISIEETNQIKSKLQSVFDKQTGNWEWDFYLPGVPKSLDVNEICNKSC